MITAKELAMYHRPVHEYIAHDPNDRQTTLLYSREGNMKELLKRSAESLRDLKEPDLRGEDKQRALTRKYLAEQMYVMLGFFDAHIGASAAVEYLQQQGFKVTLNGKPPRFLNE